jgi:hypothetical protein
VHGGRHANALERLFFAETIFDQGEHGHFLGRPLHAKTAVLGQIDIGNIKCQLFCSHEICFS